MKHSEYSSFGGKIVYLITWSLLIIVLEHIPQFCKSGGVHPSQFEESWSRLPGPLSYPLANGLSGLVVE